MAFAAAWNTSLHAADVRVIGVTKIEDYSQNEPGTLTGAGPGSFSFYVFVDLARTNLLRSGSVHFSDGSSADLESAFDPLTWDYLDFYDNPVERDLAYPPGAYSVELVTSNDGPKTVSFDLPDNFFPNAPRLLNWDDVQKIRADQPFIVRWEPFAEGTTNDFIQFSIYDFEGNRVFATPDSDNFRALNGTATSLTLPANTLPLGNNFRGVLMFARVADRDTTGYPGVNAVAGFVRQTSFPVVTAGTPDMHDIDLQLSFSYFAFAGDFLKEATPQVPFPVPLEDCYIARLLVKNEEFIPATSGVIFSSPPGTAYTNIETAFRYEGDGGFYFETPCLYESTNALKGNWTIAYYDYPIPFEVPDAEPLKRLVIPVPTVTLASNFVTRLDWQYYSSGGIRLGPAPSFITNQQISFFNQANFSIYDSPYLSASVLSLGITNGINWSNVGHINIAYQDNLGNWHGIGFDHSPPGTLTILNEELPLGSLATPYNVQLVASNGVPPYKWSVDGKLPSGLTLDSAGVISGLPQAQGTFRFGLRVDDQAKGFEYEQFFIKITTNGPPVIIEKPTGGFVDVGDFTEFEVVAEGTQPLSYQWFFNSIPIPGETNSVLWLVNIATNQAGLYSVRITNSVGSITSEAVRLDVHEPPVILAQPAGQTVTAGTDVTFNVQVRSAPPIFYQWRRNGEYIENATNVTYTIPNAQPGDGGAYDVIIAGPDGVVISDNAVLQFIVETLTLTNRLDNRVQIVGPAGLGRGSNGGANLEPGEPVHAGVPGGSSVWVEWVAPASGIATFTTRGSDFDTVLAVYTGTDVGQLVEVASDDDGEEFYASYLRFNAQAGQAYQIAIDGVYGSQGEILLNWSMDTSGARLPVILRQPVDSVVAAGGTASFSLLATNPPPAVGPLSYQWYFNGLPIPNATNDTLQIPAVNEARLGLYFATVENASEIIFSDGVVIEISTSADAIDRLVTTEDKFANLARQTNGLLGLRLFGAGKNITRLGSVARGYTGSQVFSTLNSTTEAGEPNHCGVVGGASQWFSYLAPANGFLTIDTDGSDFDTILSVYTGSAEDFESLQSVACDNDSGLDGRDSRVSFQATAGTLYFIVVDGVRGAKGTATLNYNMALPPALQASAINQQVQLRLTGAERGVFTIQFSDNLREWKPVVTTNAPAGVIELLDQPPGGSGTRFYRGFQIN